MLGGGVETAWSLSGDLEWRDVRVVPSVSTRARDIAESVDRAVRRWYMVAPRDAVDRESTESHRLALCETEARRTEIFNHHSRRRIARGR
jgi:hypothetical protein